eukprot:TRINITY_DN5634_c0_g1_i1.p1 TRINITY_DN5634_c0_g1~~TRINITY_DN5634_c0_g1_i1.p1  ORF type:complete len:213 (-),score=34.56 TRINITY_DN5634_c0_g1_i1:59-697(-)
MPPTPTLDFSGKPNILDIDMQTWHHIEGLEEIKLVECSVKAKQLDQLMLAVPTSTKRLDLSKNPGILADMDMPMWHHVEGLEEIKLVECSVKARQLDQLMGAVPTSIKRLDLSKNLGILADLDMPMWHHVEGLEEINLAGCKTNVGQVGRLIQALPPSVCTIFLDPSAEPLEAFRENGFSEDAISPGRWCRPVARPPKRSPEGLASSRCVLC